MRKNIADWSYVGSGKVRDIYAHEYHPDILMLLASDRVSAFDHVLEPEIPDKGRIITQISDWWFARLPGKNHLLKEFEPQLYKELAATLPEEVLQKATLCKRMSILPVECVVRGYLAGSAWREYQQSGSLWGIDVSPRLEEGDMLLDPVFTPTTKAEAADVPLTFSEFNKLLGVRTANRLRQLSMDYYRFASDVAADKGLILADVKFEFGLLDGEIYLADEALTPDSARYWDADAWSSFDSPLSFRLASFDKQQVRDWLAKNWSRTGKPPQLTQEVVDLTRYKYQELLQRLTD